MTRDYSQFLPNSTPDQAPRALSTLETLGWQPFFSSQLSVEEMTRTPPARVMLVHRNGLHVSGDGFDAIVPPVVSATVGDWLLYNAEQPTQSQVLARKSLIKRRAPGKDLSVQMIAANIDTVFVVTSCNADFNVARLERYIALAFEADVAPVILLTKSDLSDDSARYVAEAQTISDDVPVVVLDARGLEPGQKLAQWCKPGQTVAFLGSSGVGKSTLTNALAGNQDVETRAIREDDARGRHTTTRRELHVLPGHCAVLDTPGMRELQLTDTASGLADVFADLHALSIQCKFNDCAHETEPGCAVRAALEAGDLDEARLARWKKLVAEDAFNSANLAERRRKDKSFTKMVKAATRKSRK